MDSILEVVQRLAVPKYAPITKPMPKPEAAYSDKPLLCLPLNVEWLAYLVGVMEALAQSDAWQGDEDERQGMVDQVNNLIVEWETKKHMCCCETPLTRVTEDGQLEISYDDGVTWEDATPSQDPRIAAPQLPPLTGDDGDEKRCIAANNVLGQFRDGVSAFEGYFDTSATVLEFVTACAGLIAALIFAPAAAPIIVPIIIGLMTAIWGVGKSAYTAAFTDTVWGDLLCILFEHVGSDGTYTGDAIDGIRADIISQFDSIASGAFTALLNGVQVSGLNNMARINSGSFAPCDSCDSSAHVYALDVDASFTEVFPDEDGVYTYTAVYQEPSDGKYYINVVFSNPFNNDGSEDCNNITITDNGGRDVSYLQNLRCVDGVPDPLSFCNRLLQIRGFAGVPFTVKWTLDNPDPCG